MSDPAATSSAADANGDNIPAMKEKVAEGAAPMANGSNDSNGSSGKAKEVNGEGNGGDRGESDGKDEGDDEDEEMMEDEDDMGEGVEEEDEVEEIGDDSEEEEIITEENSIELDGEPSTGANSSVSGDDNARSDSPQVISQQGGRSPHKRKAPIQVRDIEEIDSDDESNDVEEVQDDEDLEDEEEVDDSDSDIMEVEAEDPLSGGGAAGMEKKSAPNVVTIDDVKTLQRLANNAKKQDQQSAKENVVMIDTNAILAGKATSGVTITPARPKSSSSSQAAVAAMAAAGQKMPSGITISRPQASRGSPSASAAFGGADAKGQLNDPNLTDDTHVVEAPSFIVPYIYEKPPKEKFEDFSKTVRDIMEKKDKEEREQRKQEREERRQKRKEEKKAKKEKKKRRSSGGEEMDDGAVDDDDDEDFEGAEDGSGSESDGSKDEDEDVVAVFDESLFARKRSPKENFFEGTLGKFVVDLGMNLVEEVVQSDLLKQQIKRSQKDKSAGVMHAIRSLKASLEKSKEHNQPFKMELQKCSFCSFRTESELMMQHHLETPHMKNMMYRCNFCKYETRMPQEVMAHMQNEHAVRARLERAPAIHQCPQCPFEDNMKGKLSRHMKGCEKRYTPARNQLPPHDWEPPAKVPKPPQTIQQRHGQMMGGRPPMMGGGGRIGNPLQQHKMYAGMPQLQMGGRGRGGAYGQQFGQRLPSGLSMTRPGLNAAHAAAAQIRNMQQYGQQFNQNSILNNLTSNSSVTIQSVSNRGQNMVGKTNKPSISITSLPGGPRQHAQSRQQPGMQPRNPGMMRPGPGGAGPMRGPGGGMKPGFTPAGGAGGATAMAGRGGKTDFVICEICDGYIKDLEQLRNHMLWIHKVKIHPKMIHNRPPLNCQKCQFRFFTDQGLERHLLGSHGLVTASMQDLANQNKDSGRCPVCGKVYQWKLLNHVAKDHQKTLKPAHLSYKCTVCTATFGQYRLFESHVYQAHSGKGKGGGGGSGSKQQQSVVKAAAATAAATKAPVQMSKDITIIPRPAASSQ